MEVLAAWVQTGTTIMHKDQMISERTSGRYPAILNYWRSERRSIPTNGNSVADQERQVNKAWFDYHFALTLFRIRGIS